MPEEKSEERKLVDVENLEISALDDKELESVSGGTTGTVVQTTARSCQLCNVAAR